MENPYNFIRVEWWRSKNKDGWGHAFVGFCRNGDKYLTFNVRKEEDGFIPIFSPICKIGSKNGHRKEAYEHYRDQFYRHHSIQSMAKCHYRDAIQIDNLFKFRP